MKRDSPKGPSVAVLLATFNGAEFLDSQLQSLAAQEGVAIEVFARDDGSTDGTRAILARYKELWPALAAPLGGVRLGAAFSFLELLRRVPGGFDYYAFCDQDDVWLTGKLARAAEFLAMRGAGEAALYCSRVMLADRELRPTGLAPISRDGRFKHLLFENIAYGNTVVFNARAREIIRSALPEAGVIMHDWWCALVISVFGEIIYDEWPSLMYRQHGHNAIGTASAYFADLRRTIRLFWVAPRSYWPVHAQASAFLRLFGERLPPWARDITAALVNSRQSPSARVRYALFGTIIRDRPLTALGSRLLVLLGMY